jgi:hypothetical protein
MSDKLNKVHDLIHDVSFAISKDAIVVAQDGLKHAHNLIEELIVAGNKLPSQHQIGDAVWLTLWEKSLIAEVHAVHFTKSKVKYDLNLLALGGDTTRIYNIDSVYVIKKLGEDNNS